MKTAEDKAREFIVKFGGHLRIEVAYELTKLLKEQDRDTRHACAEAVISLHSEDFEGVSVIGKDAAHNACMNVKAV